MSFSARSEVSMVARKDNISTVITMRIQEINEMNITEEEKDDMVCYWYGYQDAIEGNVEWSALDNVAKVYNVGIDYKKGFEDAMGDRELWGDIEED